MQRYPLRIVGRAPQKPRLPYYRMTTSGPASGRKKVYTLRPKYQKAWKRAGRKWWQRGVPTYVRPGGGGGRGGATAPEDVADPRPQWATDFISEQERVRDAHVQQAQAIAAATAPGLQAIQQSNTDFANALSARMADVATTPMSTAPGFGVSPTAYETEGATAAATGALSGAQSEGMQQAAVGVLGGQTLAQQLAANLSQSAQQVATPYNERLSEFKTTLGQWMDERETEQERWEAEFEEGRRQFNLDFRFRRNQLQVEKQLTLASAKSEAERARIERQFDAEQRRLDRQHELAIQEGQQRFQRREGRLDREAAQAQDADAFPEKTRDWFIAKGWTQVPPKAGAQWKKGAVRGTDGSGLWRPPRASSGGGGRSPSQQNNYAAATREFGEWLSEKQTSGDIGSDSADIVAGRINSMRRFLFKNGKLIGNRMDRVLDMVPNSMEEEVEQILRNEYGF